MAGKKKRGWLRFHYTAEFRLDGSGPTWAADILREVRLPRWVYEAHDRGAAYFVRAPQRFSHGNTEARLRLMPGAPLPEVSLDILVDGTWDEDAVTMSPPASFADIHEEAEALLVLLGCRSPRFYHEKTKLSS